MRTQDALSARGGNTVVTLHSKNHPVRRMPYRLENQCGCKIWHVGQHIANHGVSSTRAEPLAPQLPYLHRRSSSLICNSHPDYEYQYTLSHVILRVYSVMLVSAYGGAFDGKIMFQNIYLWLWHKFNA